MTIDALVMYPGAGGDCAHPTLRALETALVPLHVARRDFAYRKQGRKAPDRAPKLLANITDDAAQIAAQRGPRIVYGGRSMGGRMCSMAVAEGLEAAGLVLLSYPLHPPGKPDRLRVEHFPQLNVPCLFISGTRDPFGTPDEFEREVSAIAGPVELVWLDGQRHDPKGCDEIIADTVKTWIARL